MKKRVSILLYLLCFLSMTSCSRQEAYSFMHDPETIVKIEIVHVGEKNYEKMEIEQDVLLTIEDKTSFLKAFARIEMYLQKLRPPPEKLLPLEEEYPPE